MTTHEDDPLQPYIDGIYVHPGFLLRRANQISASIFSIECAGEMTPPQFSALMLIKLVPGIDQTGVSRLMGFDRTTSALVISNMVKQGWITRLRDKTDGRRFLLEITAKGNTMIARMIPAAEKAEKRILSPFTKQEQRVFVELLQRFVENFNEDSRAPIDGSALPMARHRLRKKALKASAKR